MREANIARDGRGLGIMLGVIFAFRKTGEGVGMTSPGGGGNGRDEAQTIFLYISRDEAGGDDQRFGYI